MCRRLDTYRRPRMESTGTERATSPGFREVMAMPPRPVSGKWAGAMCETTPAGVGVGGKGVGGAPEAGGEGAAEPKASRAGPRARKRESRDGCEESGNKRVIFWTRYPKAEPSLRVLSGREKSGDSQPTGIGGRRGSSGECI